MQLLHPNIHTFLHVLVRLTHTRPNLPPVDTTHGRQRDRLYVLYRARVPSETRSVGFELRSETTNKCFAKSLSMNSNPWVGGKK